MDLWIEKTITDIKNAAEKDRSSINVDYSIYKNFSHDSGSCPRIDVSPGKEFADHFKDLGYTVKEYYECRQFVDTGVRISWA